MCIHSILKPLFYFFTTEPILLTVAFFLSSDECWPYLNKTKGQSDVFFFCLFFKYCSCCVLLVVFINLHILCYKNVSYDNEINNLGLQYFMFSEVWPNVPLLIQLTTLQSQLLNGIFKLCWSGLVCIFCEGLCISLKRKNETMFKAFYLHSWRYSTIYFTGRCLQTKLELGGVYNVINLC